MSSSFCPVVFIYNLLFNWKVIKPDKVHIFVDGQIKKSGSHELAVELENKGYEKLLQEEIA